MSFSSNFGFKMFNIIPQGELFPEVIMSKDSFSYKLMLTDIIKNLFL